MRKSRDTGAWDSVRRAVYVPALLLIVAIADKPLERTLGLWPPLAGAIAVTGAGLCLWPLYGRYDRWTFPGLAALGFVYGLFK